MSTTLKTQGKAEAKEVVKATEVAKNKVVNEFDS